MEHLKLSHPSRFRNLLDDPWEMLRPCAIALRRLQSCGGLSGVPEVDAILAIPHDDDADCSLMNS